MKHLIDGIELIGKSKDGGYKDQFYLVRTPNKQFIQLSELLYQTVAALKEEPTIAAVAERVSTLQGKTVPVKAIHFLIENKLRPLGLIKDTRPEFEKKNKPHQLPIKAPDMLHGLKYRLTIIPEKLVPIIASYYTPLFYPFAMITVFILVIVLNVWLFGFHGINAGLRQAIFEPSIFLVVFGLIMLSSLFHEIGHAAAAMFGGSKPGRIGAGLYLVWPAFFTDITDVYRLNRSARLRSDVGGVYFNLVFSLLIGLMYFITGFEPLLLLILFQNLTVIQQLMPFMRLDGYFIVSDIVGIPDLFTRIVPIVQSIIFRKESLATKDLKPWVKWVVTIWVAVTIPILIFIIGVMLFSAPSIIATAWMSASMHFSSLVQSIQQQEYLISVVRTLQLLILLLPALGVLTMIYLLGKPLVLKINEFMDEIINVKPAKHYR